jgi:hypothetical protein
VRNYIPAKGDDSVSNGWLTKKNEWSSLPLRPQPSKSAPQWLLYLDNTRARNQLRNQLSETQNGVMCNVRLQDQSGHRVSYLTPADYQTERRAGAEHAAFVDVTFARQRESKKARRPC